MLIFTFKTFLFKTKGQIIFWGRLCTTFTSYYTFKGSPKKAADFKDSVPKFGQNWDLFCKSENKIEIDTS